MPTTVGANAPPAAAPQDFSTSELNVLQAILAQEQANGALLAQILAAVNAGDVTLKTGVQVK
jgi:hypothetical protein